MIYGIGTDIIEIDRIRRAGQNPRFLERVFTKAERDYCLRKADPFPSFAVRFAAKESVYKIFGDILEILPWQEIEVAVNASGVPRIILSGNIASVAMQAGVANVLISLSHNQTMAQAFALACLK